MLTITAEKLVVPMMRIMMIIIISIISIIVIVSVVFITSIVLIMIVSTWLPPRHFHRHRYRQKNGQITEYAHIEVVVAFLS